MTVAQFLIVTPSPNAFPTATVALLSSSPFGHQMYTTPGPSATTSGFHCCLSSGFTFARSAESATNAVNSLVWSLATSSNGFARTTSTRSAAERSVNRDETPVFFSRAERSSSAAPFFNARPEVKTAFPLFRSVRASA